MDVSYDYTGKVALVTGASSGIGRASALAFGGTGAHVVVADIDEAAGKRTAEHIAAAGGSTEFLRLDVSDADGVQAAIDGIVQRHGRLDFAHNNAGIEGEHVPVADIPVDNWRRVIEIDLNAVFYCMRAELPVMERQGAGVIVNTSSASGLTGGYNLGAYTAAKHGVIGLTRAAAMDYGRSGVRVNAICPGPIGTPFLAELPPPLQQRLSSVTAFHRLGLPEEVAQSVLWLCSEGASYVTGHPLSVDGGVAVGGSGTFFEDLV
jgi:NAD(P)-dependent dehydrogenase (short-subunit alcohol dehydrogenase family)